MHDVEEAIKIFYASLIICKKSKSFLFAEKRKNIFNLKTYLLLNPPGIMIASVLHHFFLHYKFKKNHYLLNVRIECTCKLFLLQIQSHLHNVSH